MWQEEAMRDIMIAGVGDTDNNKETSKKLLTLLRQFTL